MKGLLILDTTNLTQREQAVLNVIKLSIRTKGYPPSVREIGEAVGLNSSSTVHGYLKKLEKKGILRRDPTKPRAIEILGNSIKESIEETVNVPLLGNVAAGLPLWADENKEDEFSLPRNFTGFGDLFMLRVRGDSMIEAGILEGDLLLVRSQPDAVNGEIVVALLDEEATVKRLYKEKGHIRLQPENSSMSPIITDNAKILGKVIGLLRKI